jgi:hypothetical protein
MSLNLHFNKAGLWQTPTYITEMCLMTHEGVVPHLRGPDATRALRCYLVWLETYSPAAAVEHRQLIMAHANDPDAEVWLT